MNIQKAITKNSFVSFGLNNRFQQQYLATTVLLRLTHFALPVLPATQGNRDSRKDIIFSKPEMWIMPPAIWVIDRRRVWYLRPKVGVIIEEKRWFCLASSPYDNRIIDEWRISFLTYNEVIMNYKNKNNMFFLMPSDEESIKSIWV